MKKRAFLLLLIMIAMIISSCDGLRDAVADSYDITFHSNPPDGSKEKTITVKMKEGKDLPDPKKDMGWSFDNYSFDGWKTKNGKAREKALDRSPLYAQWKASN